MIGLQDRQQLARDIQIAHDSGARLHLACQVAGIDVRTLQRNPARWSGSTRNWAPVQSVTLNPERDGIADAAATASNTQPRAA